MCNSYLTADCGGDSPEIVCNCCIIPPDNLSGCYEDTDILWKQLGEDIVPLGLCPLHVDGFSRELALSADGNVVAIGFNLKDYRVGSIRVLEWSDVAKWIQKGKDITVHRERPSVALSADGSVLAIGEYLNEDNGPSSGRVRIFRYTKTVWTQEGNDINGQTSDTLGWSVDLSSDASIVAIGSPGYVHNPNWPTVPGYVRVYSWNGSVWTQVGNDIQGSNTLPTTENFGTLVSLSSNGTVLATGQEPYQLNYDHSGHAQVFKLVGDVWTQLGDAIDGYHPNWTYRKSSLDLSADGAVVAVGANTGDKTGQVRVLQLSSGEWKQLGDIIYFPAYIALSLQVDEGIKLAIGWPGYSDGIGSVAMYSWDNETWNKLVEFHGDKKSDGLGGTVEMSLDGSIISSGLANFDGVGSVRVFKYQPENEEIGFGHMESTVVEDQTLLQYYYPDLDKKTCLADGKQGDLQPNLFHTLQECECLVCLGFKSYFLWNNSYSFDLLDT